jgi:hypothetical protein
VSPSRHAGESRNDEVMLTESLRLGMLYLTAIHWFDVGAERFE